jgi:hypothetical protein
MAPISPAVKAGGRARLPCAALDAIVRWTITGNARRQDLEGVRERPLKLPATKE